MEYSTNTRLDQNSKDTIIVRVQRVLSFRRATLKFPLDKEQVEDIAAFLYTPNARMLMMQLADVCPDVVNWESGIAVTVSGHSFVIPHHTHDQGTPAPCRGYGRRQMRLEEVTPDTPHYTDLMDWVQDARRLDCETSNLQSIVSAVVNQLGTYGQVLRLWPNVHEWLPNRDKLRNSAQQQRRSSLPADFRVTLREHPGTPSAVCTLKLWEMKDKLIDVDTKLAMALMTKAAMGNTTDNGSYSPPVWV